MLDPWVSHDHMDSSCYVRFKSFLNHLLDITHSLSLSLFHFFSFHPFTFSLILYSLCYFLFIMCLFVCMFYCIFFFFCFCFANPVLYIQELYHRSYEIIAVMFASIPKFMKDFYVQSAETKDGLECIRFLNEIIGDFDEVCLTDRFSIITILTNQVFCTVFFYFPLHHLGALFFPSHMSYRSCITTRMDA